MFAQNSHDRIHAFMCLNKTFSDAKANFGFKFVKMGANSNLKVFVLLHVLEGLASLSCGIIHTVGFGDSNEPTTHQMIFLVPFFGFFAVSFIEVYKLLREISSRKREAVSSTVGFIVFNFTSMMSMINIENDRHLWNMTDQEENNHPYFVFNRLQSIGSLFNAMLLLLRLTFVIDLFVHEPSEDARLASEIDGDGLKADKPLRLYFFPNKVWIEIKKQFKKLENYCKK